MQHQLTLRANQRPETLERILRVVRHRGFEIVSLHAEQQNGRLQLSLTVQSERDITLLFNQLAKLEDIEDIEQIGA